MLSTRPKLAGRSSVRLIADREHTAMCMQPAPAHSVRDYLPIAEHGVIGDQRSVALVATDGTIDWFCPERFDSPSLFAAILDRERGGFYRVAPMDAEATSKQLYLPDTNVLITRFLSEHGVADVLATYVVDKGKPFLVVVD